MGRLAGFRYRDVVQRLQSLGFVLLRDGKGSHEVWKNPKTGARAVLSAHRGDYPEGTLRAILDKAGIAIDDFLSK